MTAVPDVLRRALLEHHPVVRSETGPLAGCRCGQVKLGQDVIAHVAAQVVAAMPPSPAEEAVKRVEALCGHQEAQRFVLGIPVAAIRAALASPAPAPQQEREIPYMLANTPEEFERVRRIPWLEQVTPDSCGHTDAEGCTGHGDF